MFGDFATNFGFGPFPFESVDVQGGLFGQNAPLAAPDAATGAVGATKTAPQSGLPSAPAAGVASPAPGGGTGSEPQQVTAMGTGGAQALASPLAAGQVAAPENNAAPAAGVGSPFGKPSL